MPLVATHKLSHKGDHEEQDQVYNGRRKTTDLGKTELVPELG